MIRRELLSILSDLSPALSSQDFVPILSCFCFDGEKVVAYDDILAIVAPCEFPIIGGLSGKLLLKMLSSSKAKEVEFTLDESEVTIKMSRSRLKMPLAEEKEFIFKPSKMPRNFIEPSNVFFERLEAVCISAGHDPAHPTRMGVTITFDESSILFYSSDNITMSRGEVEVEIPSGLVGKAYILPERFCRLMCDWKDKGKVRIGFGDMVVVECEPGLMMYTKPLDGADPNHFEEMVNRMGVDSVALVEIPESLVGCLERSFLLLNGEERFVQCGLQDDRIILFSESSRGELTDKMKFQGELDDVQVSFAPERVSSVLGHVGEIGLNKSYVLLVGEGVFHLISAVTC